MPKGWAATTLGECVQFMSGGTPSKSRAEFWDGSIPWVSAKDMKRWYLDDTEDHVTEAGAMNGTRVVSAGTVFLLTRGMTLLNEVPICVARVPMSFNQDVKAVIPTARLEPAFLPYLLLGQRERLLSLVDLAGHGTGRLNSAELKSIEVLIPPTTEQADIANVLRSLDDKIELNGRISETLEAIARTTFRSWFVDFDPVLERIERSKVGATSTEASALFPDRFYDSALGAVPEGWMVSTFSNVCEKVFSGGTPRTAISEYWGGGIPWLTSGETRSKFISETEKSITEPGVEGSSTRLARAGATVLAAAGQGHTRGQASLLLIDTYISQSVVAMVADQKLVSDTYLFFDLERRYDQFRQISDGHSSRGSLTTKLLGSLHTVIPPRRVVEAFENLVAPIVRAIGHYQTQSRTLCELRDSLLPKLMSGELRIDTTREAMAG